MATLGLNRRELHQFYPYFTQFSINLMRQVTRVQTLDFGVAGVGVKFDGLMMGCVTAAIMACSFNPFFLRVFYVLL